MAISYVSATNQASTSITTMPTHQAGDMIVIFAFRDSNTTAITVPAGWTKIAYTIGGTVTYAVVAFKIAASSSETSGTWTNATDLICHVYRGAGGPGAVASTTASSATVNYPALSLVNSGGDSWVAGFSGHQSTNSTYSTPPTGMTNRTTLEGATADAAGHDTNGAVASWSSTNVSTAETAAVYITFTIEILPATRFVAMTNKSSASVPTGASGCYVTLIGGGGAGASGATRNGSTRPSGYGGAGGGGGAAVVRAFVPASSLGTTYSLTLGTGAAAPTATSQNGSNGNASTFVYASGGNTISAGGGNGGTISLTPTGGTGGTYSVPGGITYNAIENGASGGNGGNAQFDPGGGAGAAQVGGNSTYAGAGGGGGGANLTNAYGGGAGGSSGLATGGTGSTGSTAGKVGGWPNNVGGYGGAGGGGGAGGTGATNGGVGGNGGGSGGGGGGGGGKEGSFSGAAALGAGGADGYTLIEWVFTPPNLFFQMWY